MRILTSPLTQVGKREKNIIHQNYKAGVKIQHEILCTMQTVSRLVKHQTHLHQPQTKETTETRYVLVTITAYMEVKDTLWVFRRDESLVHVSVDISLITKDILDHYISLKS